MNIVFQGKIIEVIQDGKREFARRSPGTRLLIVKDGQIMLTKEHREELKDFDYRLPGGKVFDTLAEYNQFVDSGNDILIVAQDAAKKEAREEVGIEVSDIKHIWTSVCGATVIWDLYYFVVSQFTKLESQSLEEGENIKPVWFTYEEARQLALTGKMSEDRSVAVLLRFLNNQT